MPTSTLEVGRKAPAFSLPDQDGQTVKLDFVFHAAKSP